MTDEKASQIKNNDINASEVIDNDSDRASIYNRGGGGLRSFERGPEGDSGLASFYAMGFFPITIPV